MHSLDRKCIIIDRRASKEFKKFPKNIQNEFIKLLDELKAFGTLQYPDSKKLSGYNLFEIRINQKGAWRCIYLYMDNNEIKILSFFNKKSRKTNKRELDKALNRIKL